MRAGQSGQLLCVRVSLYLLMNTIRVPEQEVHERYRSLICYSRCGCAGDAGTRPVLKLAKREAKLPTTI